MTPEQVFLVPMKDIKYTVLFKSFLRKYEIPTDQRVSENELFNTGEGVYVI